MRFLWEESGRGRCTLHGFCECLPPWRGPMCEVPAPPRRRKGHTEEKNFTALLHYLTSNDA